ncbi:MAG TPA: apolipoprotein N-acyltransferase, partial [Desulfatiglandales bacterium]|nr:apolipoprotein N-acyltransferase [Desulfatiglandales bacterium]
CLEDKSRSDAFKLGLLTGLFHYLSLIYWIVVVLHHYGNIPFILSLAALLLLSLYLALYIALFALILIGFRQSRLSSFWGASIWVSLEYARANLLTGFPWCLLGYTQYSRLSLIQVSDIGGVYIISFVIVLVNLTVYHLLFNSKSKKSMAIETIFASLLIGFMLLYGYRNVKEKAYVNLNEKRIKVAIAQGNIDQSLKWDREFQEKTLEIYEKLSEKSAGFKPQMIIWPETAFPFFFQDKSGLSEKVYQIAKTANSYILFGSPAYEQGKDTILYFNRAYIVSGYGVVDYYDKVHLVPFGEYVPLKKYIPFVQRLVPAAGDFSPGCKIKPIDAQGFHAGILICFESIFPYISRKHALEGAELLVNLTNDAWFGRTSAPYQHLSMAVFRCVENGLPMARAANTGISAFILSSGKIIKKSGLFVEGMLQHEIKLKCNKTFYSQFGDIFAIILMFTTILKLFLTQAIRR